MKREVIYVRRYVPKPVRIYLWIVFLFVVIGSLVNTYRFYRYNQEKQHHVHTRRSAR